MSDDYETHELEMAFKAGATSRDAEIAELERKLNEPVLLSEWQQLEKERDQLREQVKLLRDAATRAHRKLSAYVGVCTGDKELTNTIIPMLKEALAATEPTSTPTDT